MSGGVMDMGGRLLQVVATFPTYAAAADWIEYQKNHASLMVVELDGGDA
jgi:hypothetical protein